MKICNMILRIEVGANFYLVQTVDPAVTEQLNEEHEKIGVDVRWIIYSSLNAIRG